jgi:hypothetical protein
MNDGMGIWRIKVVEFQFFEGCPNAAKTLENLQELVDKKFIAKDEVEITEIKNQGEAKKLNFQGSPTVLVNGIDIYTGEKPKSFSYSCRSYDFNGKRTGVLGKEFILGKYAEFCNR